MDIHRCRFVEYQPSAINALAFTHNTGSVGRKQPLRLAVGRANGDIEIWDPRKGLWVHETTLRGGKDRSIEGLAWIQEPEERRGDGEVLSGKLRLFSIGYSSVVTEWDLRRGSPMRHSSGSHSEVWCLAAQPKERITGKKNDKENMESTQDLVVGCADGSLVLLSTADDDLAYRKYIARASKKTARALSLCFQDRNTLVAGFADSAIRVYNVGNGHLLRTMSLGAGPQRGPKDKLVWTLDCLKDGTIVSGDSAGETSFWDGKTYSQLQRIKAHEADILCLVGSEDGKTVISGGIDRRTVIYKLTGGVDERKKWAKTSHSRNHKHDIKAMTRFENPNMSIAVSGGLDTTPIVLPIREYGREYHRALPYAPQQPQVTSAGRLVVSWDKNEIFIWRILRRKKHNGFGFGDEGPNYKKFAQVALKGDENITSVDLQSSGRLLAVASSAETKVFQLRPRPSGPVKVSKILIASAPSETGARIVKFSPDGQWLLCVSLTNEIRVYEVKGEVTGTELVEVVVSSSRLRRRERERLKQNGLNGDWGDYSRTIVRAAFSTDSRIFAVADLDGYIDAFMLDNFEKPSADGVSKSQNGRRNGSSSESSEDSSSESDSDSDSDSDSSSGSTDREKSPQRWTALRPNSPIPRLPAHPLVMSFRPSTSHDADFEDSMSRHENSKLPNGNSTARLNGNKVDGHSEPYPPLHAIEDRLFILTATHEIYEYSVTTASLTAWSRRNTSNLLPNEFKLQRDRAIGCVWDVSRPNPSSQASPSARERIWLYSATWLCMFDLAQDFPAPQPAAVATKSDMTQAPAEPAEHKAQSTTNKRKGRPRDATDRKRKRDPGAAADDLARKRASTGAAGSRIPDAELGGGLGARTFTRRGADGSLQHVPVVAPADADADDDQPGSDSDSAGDGNGDAAMHALARHRRGAGANGARSQVPDSEDDADEQELDADDDDDAAAAAAAAQRPPFYLTTRYRPILGVVPLAARPSRLEVDAGGGDDDGGAADGDASGGDEGAGDGGDDGEAPVEVALVERPFFDLALPPRFDSAQDRDG